MRLYTKQLIGLLAIPLLLLGSCSGDKTTMVVAKVGDRTITVSDFEHAYNTVRPEYLPESSDMDGLLEFLDIMIEKEMLAVKADELGYDKDPYVVQGLEMFKKFGMQAGYLRSKLGDKWEITDEDIQTAYERWGTAFRVKQILTDTEAEAWEVHAMLKEGADFESVCKQYSKGPDAEVGGKMLTINYGGYPPKFHDQLFNTKIGDITEPAYHMFGYFVIKILSKDQPPRKPLDEILPDVERTATGQRRARVTQEMSDEVRDKYGFQFHEDNIGIVWEALPKEFDPFGKERSHEVYPLLDIALDDLDKPLVSYADKSITIQEFSDRYDRSHPGSRPDPRFRWGGIRKYLIDIVMNDLVYIELQNSGIENEPVIARVLRSKRDELMVQRMYEDLVDRETEITSREIETFYEDHKESFYSDAQRRFKIVLTGDRKSAEVARSRLLEGGSIDDIAAEFATTEQLAETQIHNTWLSEGQNPEMDVYGFKLRDVGDITEPFEVSQGWVVAKFMDKRPERYLPVSDVERRIEHELKQGKNEERLQVLLAKWREEISIEIVEKNLKKADLEHRAVRGQRAAGG